MTNVQILQNEGEWHIRGSFDTTGGAGTVSTVTGGVRGTNFTVTKTNTGEYTIVVKGNAALKLVELLTSDAWFSGLAPTAALGARISSVTQAATDDITIILKTTATAGGSGADTNLTANSTVNFEVIVRTVKMGSPL